MFSLLNGLSLISVIHLIVSYASDLLKVLSMKYVMILLAFLTVSGQLAGQQCIRGNCVNGFGTMLYSDGSKFTGEFKSGLREGKGLYYYSNRNKYFGEWKKDLRVGEGKMEFTNGDVYTGSFLNNQMHGQGTMEFGRGDKYIGQWAENKPNGKGSYFFKSGERYEGEFVNALFEGQGTLYYKSGSYYSGNWKASKKDGQGSFYDIQGKIIRAIWSQDQVVRKIENTEVSTNQPAIESPQRDSVATSHSSVSVVQQKPEKTFAETENPKNEEDEYFEKIFGNQKESKVIDTVADNAGVDRFFGEEPTNVDASVTRPPAEVKQEVVEEVKPAKYEDEAGQVKPSEIVNKPIPMPAEELANATADANLPDCNHTYCADGRGVFRYGDGSRYIGEFFQGEPLGKGVCYYANGDRYEGQWKNHSPNGEGIMYFASGLIYGAIWEQGKAIKELSRKKEFVFDPAVPVDESDEVKIWAVIIGIARYEHMPVLKYSDDDAYKIYAFLKSPEGGALKDNQIRVLIDEDANRTSILTALNQVFLRADENDVVMLYYSGHGLEGTFLPIDYDGFQNILKHEEVKDIINRSKAKNKICFIDACHSGSLLATKGSFSSSLMYFYDKLGQSSGGTAFIMSSKSKEYSLEDGGLRQGVFSHFLIRGLKGEADNNLDKTVQLKELFEYVYRNVRDYTGNAQSPMIAGEYDELMPVGFIREE